MKHLFLSLLLLAPVTLCGQGIPVIETGGKAMPDEWIDIDTGHRIIKLTRRDGANRSFYFHNHPFVGDEARRAIGYPASEDTVAALEEEFTGSGADDFG